MINQPYFILRTIYVFNVCLPKLGPSWCHIRPSEPMLEPSSATLGPYSGMLGYLEAMLGYFEVILDHLGTHLAAIILGPS
jgi:hypothetical protein